MRRGWQRATRECRSVNDPAPGEEYGPTLRDYPSENQLAARARSGIRRRELEPLVQYLRSPYAMDIPWAPDLAELLEDVAKIRFRKRGRRKVDDAIATYLAARTVADFYAEQKAITGNRKRALHATMEEFDRGKTWVEQRLALCAGPTDSIQVAQAMEAARRRHLAKLELKQLLQAAPRPLRTPRVHEK